MIIIETSRILLRRYQTEDITAMYPVFQTLKPWIFYPAPFSLQQTQNWIQRNLERYDNDGYGLWACA
jgi:ribosomal-protein-alanine N-acetyltransferase